MSDFLKKFGKRVNELRKKQGFTQEQLAEKIGIGIRSLGKIENGNNFPATDNLEKLVSALNVTTSEMFNFEHLQNPKNLTEESIKIINGNPDKITEIYKVIKALTS